MSLSPRGCAPRHAPMQTEDFSALKSSSFERTYPPHNMWNPSKADVSDVNRPYKLESPSPMKFRRFSRRLSGEESCDTDWISIDEESRFGNDTRQNAMSSYSSDSAQNEQFAEYYHDPRFSRESPDATYPSGFNIQLLKEPLHRNSQSCGVIDQDHLRKLSKSHGSRWTKNHQKALHTWSPRVSSSHRSSRSENQRHRKEHHRRSEPPYRSDARVDLNSPGKPNIQSRNGSPGKRFSSPVKPFDASKCNKTSILAKVLSQSPTNTSSSSKNGDYSKYFSFQGMEEGRLFKSPHKDKNERSALIKILDQKYRKKKKKKKKKNKDRRKSRSRSEERRIGSLDKVYKEEQSPAGGAHLIAPSQGNCTSAPCGDKTESDIKRGRESQTLDSRTVSRSNTLVTRETPDSYICAIVRKRRTSSQDNEGSAVLKFTRVEGQSRKRASPRKSGLAGSMKQDQDSTPTSAKKTERSYASIQAITPPTESEPVAKQNAAHRSSPIKGDFKPKALIKPGLRSTKKETKSADESQRRSPQKKKEKEDSGRRMVQKTLESYFFKSVSEAKTKVQPVKAGPTETVGNADITKCADQGNPNKSHVRRIYCDEAESASRAVVQLTPISEVLISKLRSPKPAAGSAPRGRWGSTPRMAEVRPILSPAKERPESSPPADLAKVASRVPRVTRTTSLESAAPDQPVQPLDELVPEEDLVQAERDQAEAEVTKAAQRNRKRHTRGHKVFAFCDVLQEHIERHPVQNEIPVNKWSKWLNPAQSRCLVSAMLDNTDLCLNFSMDADRNEEWEEYWVKLARRLNTVCFNDLTNLNTGLRMTVSEWKTCWLDLKKTVKTRVDAMTAKERVHNLGSLDCLLYSKDLFTALINSKGECLGDECPKIWCPGACVGVFCPEPVSRTTEE